MLEIILFLMAARGYCAYELIPYFFPDDYCAPYSIEACKSAIEFIGYIEANKENSGYHFLSHSYYPKGIKVFYSWMVILLIVCSTFNIDRLLCLFKNKWSKILGACFLWPRWNIRRDETLFNGRKISTNRLWLPPIKGHLPGGRKVGIPMESR